MKVKTKQNESMIEVRIVVTVAGAGENFLEHWKCSGSGSG